MDYAVNLENPDTIHQSYKCEWHTSLKGNRNAHNKRNIRKDIVTGFALSDDNGHIMDA